MLATLAAALLTAAWGYDGFARRPPDSSVAPARVIKPTLVVPVAEPPPPVKPPAERKPAASPAPKRELPPEQVESRPRPPATQRMFEGEDVSGKTWHCADRDELVRFLDARNRALRAGSRPAPQAYFPPIPQPLPQSYSLGPQSSLFGSPAYCAPGGT